MAQKRWKRRQMVVDRDFQFRYLMTWITLTMTLVAGLLIASMAVVYLCSASANQVVWLIAVNGACAVVITGVSLYYIVRHSHRIAGPAFRLERLLREAAAGRRGFRVTLRRKDYLKRLASALNELMESIEKRENRVHELALQIGEISVNGHDVGKVRHLTAEVSRELVELCPKTAVVKDDGTA